MRRRLFNFAVVVSASVCVAALSARLLAPAGPPAIPPQGVPGGIASFVSSASGLQRVEVRGGEVRSDWFVVVAGTFAWSQTTAPNHDSAPDGTGYRWAASVPFLPPDPRRPGFAFDRAPGYWLYLSVPCWFVVALTSVLPAAWAAGRWRRHRRAAAGRCRTCGYDLRATPDRCPECGAEREMVKSEC